MTRKKYCGNLLWQSSLTLLALPKKPKSPLQCYRLLRKGKDVLA